MESKEQKEQKVQNVDIESNSISFIFLDNMPFDPNILINTQSSFEKLDRFKKIKIDIYGNIPFEMLGYLVEVANHCTMEVNIFDDEKGSSFMEQLKNYTNSNIKIKYIGDNNGRKEN